MFVYGNYYQEDVMSNKWVERFIDLSKHISEWSKDPSTKVGAVIVRPDKSICSTGFNGFPRNIIDWEHDYNDRETKYKKIIHAETNAIFFAGEQLENYSLFTYPFAPCSRCAGNIIQTHKHGKPGIKHVFFPKASEEVLIRWKDDLLFSINMLNEAGLVPCEIDLNPESKTYREIFYVF